MKTLLPVGLLLALAGAMPVFAAPTDTLELDNGDRLHGQVVAVDADKVQFRSEIHGELSLERRRVIGIVFGDARRSGGAGERSGATPTPAIPIVEPPSPETPMAAEAGEADGQKEKQETPAEIIRRLAAPDFGPQAVAELDQAFGRRPAGPNPPAEQTPEDVVRQLRAEGLDPALMNELQLRLPGFASPEVQGYFHDRVGGLISGKISLQDIRDDAIDARDQLLDLKKDLGPDAAALDGYLGILEGFIRVTAPGDDSEQDLPLKELLPPSGGRRAPPMTDAPAPMIIPPGGRAP